MDRNIEGLQKANAERTSLEAREIGRKGGLASGEARRKKKLLRDVFNDLLPREVQDSDVRDALEAAGLEPTHESALALAVMLKAERGDVDAAKFIRDTRGEKPSEKLAVGNMIDIGYPVHSMDLSKLSDEELYALIDELEEKESSEQD